MLSQSLAKLAASESERQANLSTLERLTALYDIGRTFTSTLELEDLVPIVAGKVREFSVPKPATSGLWMRIHAISIWLGKMVKTLPLAKPPGGRLAKGFLEA